MAAKVNAVWIDVRLLGEEIGGRQDVVHLTEESLLDSGVVVAAPQRRQHHDDPGFAKGTGRLAVGRLPLGPATPGNRVAVSVRDPDDRRSLLAVFRVGSQVGG